MQSESADRIHARPVCAALVGGAPVLQLFRHGRALSTLMVLYLLIAVVGASTIGTQILAYAGVAQFYPMAMCLVDSREPKVLPLVASA